MNPMDFNKFKKLFKRPSYVKTLLELKRLRDKTKQGILLSTALFGEKFYLKNGVSFSFLYNEIIENEIYRFESQSDKPYIIDCGANIGVSVIYFKKHFPKAEIVAFEPDPVIFDILSSNLKQAKFEGVTLVNKAIWNAESEITFYAEGGDAGRIAQQMDKTNLVKVPTISLRPYMDREIDLLKIDIEGAELVVLDDIADVLYNVKNIFVEYHSFTDKPQHLSKVVSVLENAGFRLHITVPGASHAFPFVQKNKSLIFNMDMQLNIYGFRV